MLEARSWCIDSDCFFASAGLNTNSAKDANCLSELGCGNNHVKSSLPSVMSGGSAPCASAVVIGAALAITKLGVSSISALFPSIATLKVIFSLFEIAFQRPLR